MQLPLHFSLCVATIGRYQELDRLLSSLQVQRYPYFHVYIANQNPQGFLDDVLQAYSESMSITVVSIPACGVSAARNALLPFAQGDIIAFPDDDCWYEPDTLAAVVDFFQQNPQCASILGKWVEASQGQSPSECTMPLSRYAVFSSGGTHVQFYRRDAVRAVGEFDPLLGPGTGLPWGCGEDTDYALRAIAHGFCVGRVPSVRVHHQLPALEALTRPLVQKHTAYALGRMYLLKKHAFPLWFKLLNVFYPLALLPLDTLRQGRVAAKYRWAMFRGRLRGLFL